MELSNIFSMFGVSFKHPENWRVWCDPKTALNYNNGVLKFDEAASDHEYPYTLTLTWTECIKEGFSVSDYQENFVIQLNNAKDFTLEEVESGITNNGHQFVLTKLRSLTGKGVFKLKKDRSTFQIQLAYYDSHTNRLIVADLCSHPSRINEDDLFWRELLYGIDS